MGLKPTLKSDSLLV